MDVVDYYSIGLGSEYIFQQAANYWNDTADTRIDPGPLSTNPAFFDEYEDEWFGLYTPTSNGFNIRVNERTLKNYANNNPGTYNQYAINTAVHEFGHALYLGDLETGYGDLSIMSYERDRLNSVPRSLDITNINQLRDEGPPGYINSKPNADWPQIDFTQVMRKSDIVGVAEVEDIEIIEVEEIDGGLLERQFSTLNIKQGSNETTSKIVLNQAVDFVKEGGEYLMFLRKGDDGYYYELNDKTVIEEEEGMFVSIIPGFKKSIDSNQWFSTIFDR